MIGTEITHYRIERSLGEGGMGQVYLATDTRLDRPVALKGLSDRLRGDPKHMARFHREARVLASLRHPNIATIYGLEESRDQSRYLVLEYIEGEDLEHRVGRGAMDVAETRRILQQVASALEAAHARGVLHRDLKLGNVMIDAGGQVKLLDFGLARPGGEDQPEGSVAATRTDLSLTGNLFGSPGYMSPEQARGEVLDERTDLFALGVIGFECLTGVPAFPGASPMDRIAATLTKEPDWERIPEGVDPGLRRALDLMLRKDRDERPPTATRVLEILQGDEQLAQSTTVVVSQRERRLALPAQTTSFVGRESETEEVLGLVPSTKTLTLTGPGGCGKTRLALHAAEAAADRFPDGVCFVDLSATTDPGRVGQALADALRLHGGGGESPVELIAAHLAERKILLLVDNCEHVLEAVRELESALLQRCPHLTFLNTSREPVALSGEQIYRVPSFPLPNGATQPSALERIDSVRLFVERARLVNAGFSLDEETAPAVAEICRRLDGIPLAIELAAARTRVLPPQEISRRLDDRFRLLKTESHGTLPRQQTLRATFDWSYELLSEAERELLHRLCQLAGTWSLDAAHALEGPDADDLEVLDALTRLVDRSWVIPLPGPGYETRYRMLETAKQYLREKAGAADPELVRRVVTYFSEWASSNESEMRGKGQTLAFERLDAEQENLIQTMRWASAVPELQDRALELIGILWWYWEIRGRLQLAGQLIPEIISSCGEGKPSAGRARALSAAGNHAFRQNRYEDAERHHAQSLAVARAIEDAPGITRSLNNLGLVTYRLGRFDDAQRMYEEAIERSRELGNRQWEAICQTNLGVVAQHQGDPERSRESYERALVLMRELGDKRSVAITLGNLGVLARLAGKLERAHEYHAESLALRKELGDRRGIAISHGNYASLLAREDRLDEAREHLGKSLRLHLEMEKGGDASDVDAARALDAAASYFTAAGDPERAARILGAKRELHRVIGSSPPPNEEREHLATDERLKQLLGESAHGRLEQEGASWSLVEALEHAQAGIDRNPKGAGD